MQRRELPLRPSFEQYKKQAKDLVKALNAGEPEALARIHDRNPGALRSSFKLSDAQWIIAREHAFENWRTFARHVQALPPVSTSTESIRVDGIELPAEISVPAGAVGLVVFASASGSGRYNPKDREVVDVLHRGALGTILTDLLTEEEELADLEELRFDIRLLSHRLVAITDWIGRQSKLARLALGYFGSGTGSAAAVVAAGERSSVVRAVASSGGRPDLAGPWLGNVRAATLLIVGSKDTLALGFNYSAMTPLPPQTVRKLDLVDGLVHKTAALAHDWFRQYLTGQA